MTSPRYAQVKLRVFLTVDILQPENMSALNMLLNLDGLTWSYDDIARMSLSQLVTLLTGFSEDTQASLKFEDQPTIRLSGRLSHLTTQLQSSVTGHFAQSQSSTSPKPEENPSS